MATRLSIDSMLTSNPDTCGGLLRVEGTRITLHQIVVHYKRGESAEEIASHYPQLSLAQVYAGLAYYHAHQAAVEADLAAALVEAERLERLHSKKPSRP